jgi:hypothetical protein
MHQDLYSSIFKCLIVIGDSTHPLALLPRLSQRQATQTIYIIIKLEEFSEILVGLLRVFFLDSLFGRAKVLTLIQKNSPKSFIIFYAKWNS